MKRGSSRDGERGFALLLVFLMAAAIAIMLYKQMPRVAFESQREKEQLLIDRGQQYVRGIQMYYVAYQKFPSKMEDLENTNNHRYLRRRYIDPMTGTDEWRLIHVNGAGQLTDSLVTKPPNPAGGSGASGASGASGTSGGSGVFGSTVTTTSTSTDPSNPTGQPQVNPAVLKRPSDMTLATPTNGMPGSSTEPPDPNDPKYWPPIALYPASGTSGAPGVVPGQSYPGQQIPGQPNSAMPGSYQPGQNATNGNPNPLPVMPTVPGQTAPPGFPQPNQFQPQGASGANPVSNAAVGMIQQMLTTPHQAPTDSNFGSGTGAAQGFAGVATTFKGPSIKIYKDHQKYQEWEFVFDLKQGTSGQPGSTTGQQGQPGQVQQNGQQPSNPTGSVFGQSTSPTTPQPQPQQQQQQN